MVYIDDFKTVLMVVYHNTIENYDNMALHQGVFRLYFPNIIYCGPQTMGPLDEFIHTPRSGFARFTHYSCLLMAMEMYPDYTGYMHTGFDVSLDVARLRTFDQKKVWGISISYSFSLIPIL